MPHSPLVDPGFFVRRWMKTWTKGSDTHRHGTACRPENYATVDLLMDWSKEDGGE
jgi:hypothetical protein